MSRVTRNLCSGRHRQAGTGLIEVMIAVLILSIGLLGMASLQMWTLKNNQSSLERGMAVVQIYSIVDTMHADRTNAMNGAFDIDIDAAAPGGATFADISVATWRTSLADVLGPDASGAIDCNGALCTIAVRWNDQRGEGGDALQRVATEVQL